MQQTSFLCHRHIKNKEKTDAHLSEPFSNIRIAYFVLMRVVFELLSRAWGSYVCMYTVRICALGC